MNVKLLLLAASLAAPAFAAPAAKPVGAPIVRPGADKDFPAGYLGAAYRQAGINAELKRREFPYRVYKNQRDGSFIVVEKTAAREFHSVAFAHGDPRRGPALAFGSQPRSPDDRQELSLEYALWILEQPESQTYSDAFFPYKQIGRFDLEKRTLTLAQRNRVNDLLLWLGRKRPDAAEWAQAVEKALIEAVREAGGAFKSLEGVEKDGKWTFGVRTTRTRMDAETPVFWTD